jgi:hypothetical protein
MKKAQWKIKGDLSNLDRKTLALLRMLAISSKTKWKG